MHAPLKAASKTDEVMPLIVAMINRDVMPLIGRVLIKRAELYLREIEEQLQKGAPESPQEKP